MFFFSVPQPSRVRGSHMSLRGWKWKRNLCKNEFMFAIWQPDRKRVVVLQSQHDNTVSNFHFFLFVWCFFRIYYFLLVACFLFIYRYSEGLQLAEGMRERYGRGTNFSGLVSFFLCRLYIQNCLYDDNHFQKLSFSRMPWCNFSITWTTATLCRMREDGGFQ